MTHTHYSIRIMDGGGLARGMYTCSAAYETRQLAREYGTGDPQLSHHGQRALVRVETRDDDSGGRALVRETILEVLAE